MKYILISGGVVSGLGKGITSSSLGVLMKASGLRVTSIKIDPYLNIDAGTMSPFEHGECYVMDDGGEADLDLGNYERFLNVTLTKDHNITTGKIYKQVIDRERRGDYLGKTVQVVPHATDSIMAWIERVAQISVDGSNKVPDVCLIELGGTVGDIESMVFLEALRQFRHRIGGDNFCHIHVTLVPIVGAGGGEQKTKPTQHGIKELRAAGLLPDMLVCRCKSPLSRNIIAKISLFCMIPSTNVISVHDVSNIYKVPGLLLSQRVPDIVLGILRFNKMPPEDLPHWKMLAAKVDSPKEEVNIGIVGKYTGLTDSYLSVSKALFHAAIEADLKLNIEWINSSMLEPCRAEMDPEEHAKAWAQLKSVDGVLIPGGFGDRGVEGKILTVKYVRENDIPFLGICLGMQVAVIEYARNVCDMPNASSAEFNENSEENVIVFMPEISTSQMGGTMRLGSRPSKIQTGTLAHSLYKNEIIHERHRHRYEVNPAMVEKLEGAGLLFSGRDDDQKGERMEITELPSHKFFIGVQFHPEYKSQPFAPSPPFRGLVRAAGHIEKTPPGSPSRAAKKVAEQVAEIVEHRKSLSVES